MQFKAKKKTKLCAVGRLSTSLNTLLHIFHYIFSICNVHRCGKVYRIFVPTHPSHLSKFFGRKAYLCDRNEINEKIWKLFKFFKKWLLLEKFLEEFSNHKMLEIVSNPLNSFLFFSFFISVVFFSCKIQHLQVYCIIKLVFIAYLEYYYTILFRLYKSLYDFSPNICDILGCVNFNKCFILLEKLLTS